jgi:hypothetical protein
MEILDDDKEIINPTGKILGTIGGICYLIGGIGCLFSLYGSLLSADSLLASGAPDAMQLSRGIGLVLYSHLVVLPSLLIALFCQLVAFHKYDFTHIWLWRVMLFSGICAVLSSFFPPSPYVMIIGIAALVHVFSKKSFYFFEENEEENA